MRPGVSVLLAAAGLAACERPPADVRTAERVEVALDRRNAETVVRYYLGGFAGASGGDPVAAGLLTVEDGALWLHPGALPQAARAALRDDGDGVLDGDEFLEWAAATYADARRLPATLDEIRPPAPAENDSAWFSVVIEGSPMTHARRRILVPVEALRSAIRSFAAGRGLVYPEGTVIIGEHEVGGAVAETTVKVRRSDGFWDFMVYDGSGAVAGRTATPPRPLRVPTQCTGCHLGSRQFEPDRSFPADAPPGPAGARAIVVPGAWRDRQAAANFREHSRRSDHVLGPYATIYVGRLRAERAAGRPLHPEDEELLRLLE